MEQTSLRTVTGLVDKALRNQNLTSSPRGYLSGDHANDMLVLDNLDALIQAGRLRDPISDRMQDFVDSLHVLLCPSCCIP